MKINLRRQMPIIALSIMAVFIIQCKKSPSSDTTPIIVKAEITNISPLQGLIGTVVTISGTGFDTTRATTSVKFNGTDATIKSITSTQITAEVPRGPATGAITVTNRNALVAYRANFTVSNLTITKLPVTNTYPGNAIANIAVDAAGNIFCNTNTDTVFKISPAGDKSFVAVAGSATTKLGGIAVDAAGNVYVVGTNDFKIYKISPSGSVSVFAGTGVSGYADGAGTAAQFAAPSGMVIDASGNLFVTDAYCVRKITASGQVSTFAGGANAGKADGQGTSATFGANAKLNNIAIDAAGNLYVSDGDNGKYGTDNNAYYIRKITSAGLVSTIGPLSTLRGNQGPGPTTLPFTSLLAADPAGNLYLPGSSYNTGTNASQGCCTFGPVFTVNKALSTIIFYDLANTVPLIGVTYRGITTDGSGNIYLSAAVTTGMDFILIKDNVTGSLLLKISIK